MKSTMNPKIQLQNLKSSLAVDSFGSYNFFIMEDYHKFEGCILST